MQIIINQERFNVDSEITLSEALSVGGIPLQNIAVAVNNRIIYRKEWDTFVLKEGDCLLVIKATKGG